MGWINTATKKFGCCELGRAMIGKKSVPRDVPSNDIGAACDASSALALSNERLQAIAIPRMDLGPITELNSQLGAVSSLFNQFQWQPTFEAFGITPWHDALLATASAFDAIRDSWDRFEVWAPSFEICEDLALTDRVCKAGWLPHHTTPLDLVREFPDDSPEVLRDRIDRYYAEHWQETATTLRANVISSGADSETVAGIDEAIQAHSQGLYRASCRTIFPELERAVRTRYYGVLRRTGSTASLIEFREALGNLTIPEMGGGWWMFKAYCAFSDECYTKITSMFNAANDTLLVPNRHAVAHGLASYAERRRSLITLFLADFCLTALNAVIIKLKAA